MDDDEFHNGLLRDAATGELLLVAVRAFDGLRSSRQSPGNFTNKFKQYGRLSDNYGSLRPLLVAYCTFCIGSMLW